MCLHTRMRAERQQHVHAKGVVEVDGIYYSIIPIKIYEELYVVISSSIYH